MKLLWATVLCLSNLLWCQSSLGQASLGQSSPYYFAQDYPEQLIFTNVNIIDTRDGVIKYNMMVVIRKGRIDGVAKVGLIGQGHGIRVINTNGKYMIPGLWDMHVHTGFAAGAWDDKVIYPLYIANGVIGVRDMGGNPDLLEQRRHRIDTGELLGPHMILAGPFLDAGQSDPQTIAVNNPTEAIVAVDTVKSRNFDFVKILSGLSRESYFAVADESRKQKIAFAGHVPDTVSASEASAAGQKSIEHLTGISLACSSDEGALRRQRLDARQTKNWPEYFTATRQVLATYDRNKAAILFLQFAENSTWQVPTLIWSQTNSTLDNPDWKSDPRLKYVPASVREQWDPEKLLKQTSPEQLADAKKEFSRSLELLAAIRHAGVPVVAGTDGPDPYVFPGFSLHQELELLVKAGFTPIEALRTATFNAARFQLKLDKYGLVEKGHIADLVLLDANPLEDIRNTRKISAVVLGGKYYSREDLDKILSQVEALAARE